MSSYTLKNLKGDGNKISAVALEGGNIIKVENISSTSFNTASLPYYGSSEKYSAIVYRLYPYRIFKELGIMGSTSNLIDASVNCIDKIEIGYSAYASYGTSSATKGTVLIGSYDGRDGTLVWTTTHTECVPRSSFLAETFLDSLTPSNLHREGDGEDERLLIAIGVINNATSNATFYFNNIYFNIYFTVDDQEIVTTVSPENGGVVVGGGKYLTGSEAYLTATPNNGYNFSEWLVYGKSQGLTENPLYLSAVNAGVPFTAVFKPDCAVYVKDIKALKIYVGSTEILKIT